MKEKAASHPSGDHTTEEEDLPEEEVEMEEEEAAQDQDPQEAHQPEETQPPPDLTYPLTYDLSPAPMTRDLWESSPTSSTETKPKQKRSSINSTTTSYLISTSPGSTLRLKRSPWPSRLSKAPRSPAGQGH